ncbi:hypothetical protein E5O75_03385 [Neisseria gonorrhoeae]
MELKKANHGRERSVGDIRDLLIVCLFRHQEYGKAELGRQKTTSRFYCLDAFYFKTMKTACIDSNGYD